MSRPAWTPEKEAVYRAAMRRFNELSKGLSLEKMQFSARSFSPLALELVNACATAQNAAAKKRKRK